MTTQYWKLPFKKTGYPAEEIEISTIGKISGDYITLPRKFFQIAGTSVKYHDPKTNTYNTATIGDTGTEFLLAKDIDVELTEIIGINIFTRIQLNNKNVANTTLKINYQPFGDILDPEDFSQSLTPTSDVTHNSLTLSGGLKSSIVISDNITITNKIQAHTADFESIQVDEVSIGSGPNKLAYDSNTGLLMIAGKTFPHIAPTTLTVQNTMAMLVLSPANYLETVPITWIKANSTTQDLELTGIGIKAKLAELENRISALEE